MNSDDILKIIDKYEDIINKEYVKPKRVSFNIFDSFDKTKELTKMYNYKPNTNKRLSKIYFNYPNELENFACLSDISELENNKEKLYIKYVGVNNKFGYGGFLYKFDNYYITLISQYKKVWRISINDNFIFYRRVTNENDKMREQFESFLNSTINK